MPVYYRSFAGSHLDVEVAQHRIDGSLNRSEDRVRTIIAKLRRLKLIGGPQGNSRKLLFLMTLTSKKKTKRSSSDSRNYSRTKPLKRARAIARRLKETYHWPKGSSINVAEMLQRAMDQFKWFYDQLGGISKAGPTKKVRGTAKNLLEYSFLSHDEYAERWFENVNKTIAGWPEWSGNMKMFEFAYDHKKFVQECEEKLRECGHYDPQERFQQIKELMDESRSQS